MNARTFLRHLVLVLCALALAGCATRTVTVTDTTHTFHTVVIDPGHGGKDSGAARNHLLEKNLALDVAMRLEPKLKAAGFHTVMTRTGDYFVELDERAAISNRQTNAIYVSIHFNDCGSRRFHGAEVYYHSPASEHLAEVIVKNLGSITESRGTAYASFRVLRKNRFPAVLVECGFVSNRKEAARCASPDFREALAGKIAESIIAVRRGQ